MPVRLVVVHCVEVIDYTWKNENCYICLLNLYFSKSKHNVYLIVVNMYLFERI